MPFYVGNIMSKTSECRSRAGDVDTSFGSFVRNSSSSVRSMAIQPDGKVIVCGEFTTVNSVTQNFICRLNADGTLDTSFNTGANPGAGNDIRTVALQPDGKIIVGGAFTALRGVTRNGIGRLNADGSLDTTFNNSSQGTVGVSRGSAATIVALELQSDGKILLGGNFTTARGVTQNGIARFNADGTLDTTFNIGANPGTNTGTLGAAGANVFRVLSNGDILVGGGFSTMRGVTQNGFAKLNSVGDIDTSFNAGANPGLDTNGDINDMVVQDDGKIVIVGTFTTFRGSSHPDIARSNSDGSRDTTWPGGGTGLGGALYSCTEQYDKKIIVTGFYTSFLGVTQNGIARISKDGVLDSTFNTGGTIGIRRTTGSGTTPYVYASALQDDCKILIGGWFEETRGTFTGPVARLK